MCVYIIHFSPNPLTKVFDFFLNYSIISTLTKNSLWKTVQLLSFVKQPCMRFMFSLAPSSRSQGQVHGPRRRFPSREHGSECHPCLGGHQIPILDSLGVYQPEPAFKSEHQRFHPSRWRKGRPAIP